jgi:hypothetical protein
MTRQRLVPLVLVFLASGGLLTSLCRTGGTSLATTEPAAPAAQTDPYTFPSVIHTPEETARARLVCAEAADYGWSVALRRERTGMTREEALALLAREHGGTPAFAPLEHVTYLAYAAAAGTPAWARGFVQRVCLKEMLGSLAEPKVEPPVQTTPPTQPRKSKGK